METMLKKPIGRAARVQAPKVGFIQSNGQLFLPGHFAWSHFLLAQV
jgi:hypothetical protein